jgi:hypothetical protein
MGGWEVTGDGAFPRPDGLGWDVPPLRGSRGLMRPVRRVPRPYGLGWYMPPLRGWDVSPLRGWDVPPLRGWDVPPLRGWGGLVGLVRPVPRPYGLGWYVPPLRGFCLLPSACSVPLCLCASVPAYNIPACLRRYHSMANRRTARARSQTRFQSWMSDLMRRSVGEKDSVPLTAAGRSPASSMVK